MVGRGSVIYIRYIHNAAMLCAIKWNKHQSIPHYAMICCNIVIIGNWYIDIVSLTVYTMCNYSVETCKQHRCPRASWCIYHIEPYKPTVRIIFHHHHQIEIDLIIFHCRKHFSQRISSRLALTTVFNSTLSETIFETVSVVGITTPYVSVCV